MVAWNIRLRSEELVRLSDDFQSVMNEYCVYWTLESMLQEKIVTPEGTISMNVYEYNLQFKNEDMQKDYLQALNYLQIQIVSLSKNKNK